MSLKRLPEGFFNIFASRNLPLAAARNIYFSLFSNFNKYAIAVIPQKRENMPEEDLKYALSLQKDICLYYLSVVSKCSSAREKLLRAWHFFEELESFTSNSNILQNEEKIILNGIFLQEFANAIFPDEKVRVEYWSDSDIVKKYNKVWLPYEKIIDKKIDNTNFLLQNSPIKTEEKFWIKNRGCVEFIIWIVAFIIFLKLCESIKLENSYSVLIAIGGVVVTHFLVKFIFDNMFIQKNHNENLEKDTVRKKTLPIISESCTNNKNSTTSMVKEIFNPNNSSNNVEIFSNCDNDNKAFNFSKIREQTPQIKNNKADFISSTTPENIVKDEKKSLKADCDSTFVIISDNKIESFAFAHHNHLVNVIISDKVNFISDHAFIDCKNLINVIINKGISKIYDSAFAGCDSLTGIIIPDSVNHIGSSSFENCKNMTSVMLSNNISIINDNLFINCKKLMNVTMPNNIIKIGNKAFYGCSELLNLIIPSKTQTIGNYAFSGCKGLQNIIIPDNVTFIGNGAFENCENLKNINLPNSITTIGDEVFADCKSLTHIKIPEGITEIGKRSFSGCSNLTTVIIPDGVVRIGEGAFEECEKLMTITLPDSVTKIEEWAFGFAGCENQVMRDYPDLFKNYSESWY